ncbi:MAG: phosphoribosylamine--glycine ligase [Candidatus Magasanikbacteria bacterium]|nr:phosphoribosylamine--glycine ligase [Candidatus Magasanikbacteria bacterium]
MNILLVGSGAREHTIARAIKKSKHTNNLFCFASSNNPGIKSLCAGYEVGKISEPAAVLNFAQINKIDWAFIGPEAPLEAGVVDILDAVSIPSVGPIKQLAQLETSKSFTRDLLTKYNIPACPGYKFFTSMNGVKEFIESLGGNYVVKADGLMGGKGVKVSGDHLASIDEGISWCQELINSGKTFLIEEKLIGQEFSLMSWCDGEHLAHMPAVQDHTRAFVGDTGPNTGGMGTYSDGDHSLPFLTSADIDQARKINEATAKAIKNKFNENYKGILYGGFMATKDGVKLIEYNARLGDPETMNVLPILESDFIELCQSIIDGNLSQDKAIFSNLATVCKYAVPNGYPDEAVKNELINISAVTDSDHLYLASVDQKTDGLYETGSRTVAFVGIASTIAQAEQIAETEINKITGPLFHREDIGTTELINKRIEMMKELRNI